LNSWTLIFGWFWSLFGQTTGYIALILTIASQLVIAVSLYRLGNENEVVKDIETGGEKTKMIIESSKY
jgi:hypothetical protein